MSEWFGFVACIGGGLVALLVLGAFTLMLCINRGGKNQSLSLSGFRRHNEADTLSLLVGSGDVIGTTCKHPKYSPWLAHTLKYL